MSYRRLQRTPDLTHLCLVQYSSSSDRRRTHTRSSAGNSDFNSRTDDVRHRSSKPAPTDEAAPTADRKSGRVAFDADGRGVWEWQVETGVFTRTVTENQLMDLATTNLQIVETPPANSEHRVWPHGPDRVRAELDSSTRQLVNSAADRWACAGRTDENIDTRRAGASPAKTPHKSRLSKHRCSPLLGTGLWALGSGPKRSRRTANAV
jgi:hypothetical protein